MATNITWDPRFELGHRRIDFEHRIFVDLIAELSRQDVGGGGAARFERTLREIAKYADFHFVREENLMVDVDYPLLGRHRYLHEMLLAELSDKTHAWRDGLEAPDAIVDFLFQWFALHTTQEDRRIAEFIAGRG